MSDYLPNALESEDLGSDLDNIFETSYLVLESGQEPYWSSFEAFVEFIFAEQATAPESNLTTSEPIDTPSVAENPELPPLLEISPLTTEDNKSPEQDNKVVEAETEPKYTITIKNGNATITRNQTRSTGIGRLCRMSNSNEEDASENENKPKKYGYTYLQELLQLIEPTPAGEDPYQIGEAEMREPSPIPRLMLPKKQAQKSETAPEASTSTITSSTAGTSSTTLSCSEDMEEDHIDDTSDENEDVDVETISDNEVDCTPPKETAKNKRKATASTTSSAMPDTEAKSAEDGTEKKRAKSPIAVKKESPNNAESPSGPS